MRDNPAALAETTASGGLSERFVSLAVEREGKMLVMDGDWRFQEDDRLSVAIHLPERDDALRELADAGWTPPVADAEGVVVDAPEAEAAAGA